MKKLSLATLCLLCFAVFARGQEGPLKIAVIGLSHGHAHWVFNSGESDAISIEGIVETDKALARRYAEQYGFSMDIVYDSPKALLEAKDVEAVAAFGPIDAHLGVVEAFAPLGIHVMVEKPLAFGMEDARKMEALAQEHGIHLLTNYETTWYPTNHRAYEMVKEEAVIGPIRKIIVRDGHKGPVKIGVGPEFLEWLTDPNRNGGGAITDFGCYGANLATWLMEGQRPISVTAITRQLQEENNPQVDDEAIILLNYDNAVAVLQPSWNWPIGRKDMEIYGLKGVVYADNKNDLRIRMSEGYDGFSEESFELDDNPPPHDNPFAYLRAVVRGEVSLDAYDLSSLANNMIVVEILEAAVRSASEGRTINLRD